MPEALHNLHISDDWLSAEIDNLQEIHRLIKQFQRDDRWTEVVGGLHSISVQFDPAKLAPDEATSIFCQQLNLPSDANTESVPPVSLPVCYHPEYAPDLELVANALQIAASAVADWHSQLQFTVTMLGFMPGFAYLKCDSDVLDIGRLSQPRKRVVAGSIGLIGDQSCIYSFDGPGGWPVIGRTASKLFNTRNNPAALLSAGQRLRFKPIRKSELEDSL